MRFTTSIIIPAWNEAEHITGTLQALHQIQYDQGEKLWDELIVIDDGSADETYSLILPWADHVIVNPLNQGKGAALHQGWRKARGDLLVFLDADLGATVRYLPMLLKPILRGEADMAIAKLPITRGQGGFGLVKRLAYIGIYRLSGYKAQAPLSGQRALRRDVLERIDKLSERFGIEVGLTIDVARAGFRICEVEVPFRHRETGRDWRGFLHRGKQFIAVGRTLLTKWLSLNS
jgi:glycosyltransferase involved in cell wall biosynthesis